MEAQKDSDAHKTDVLKTAASPVPANPLPQPYATHSLSPADVRNGNHLAFIGSGGFGKTYKYKHGTTQVAVKYNKADSATANAREVLMLQTAQGPNGLGHANVIGFLGDFPYGPDGQHGYVFVMELAARGDFLNHAIDRFVPPPNGPGGMQLDDARRFFRQMVASIQHLHEVCKLAHLDLKPENFALTEDGQTLKLIDMGMCHALVDGKVSGLRGTAAYVAPEAVVTTESYGPFEADIWALGAILFFITVGNYAMSGEDEILMKSGRVIPIYQKRVAYLKQVQEAGGATTATILSGVPIKLERPQTFLYHTLSVHFQHLTNDLIDVSCPGQPSPGKHLCMDMPGSFALHRFSTLRS